MPVRFIIGRAGSGKTRHCQRSILSLLEQDPLGDPILYILPRQATFEAERQLALASPTGGYCRARVISFEQLGRDILAEVGGDALPVTQTGRRMILGHLLRQMQGKLHYFNASATRLGLADELDTTFAEFERAGVDPQTIPDLLKDAAWRNSADDALVDKLRDLQVIYEAYSTFLGQERVDPQRRLRQITDALGKAESLRRTTVFIDAFHDFSHHERDVITHLARLCPSIDITITMDPKSKLLNDPHSLPDDMSPFHRTETTYRRLYFAILESNGVIDRPMLLPDTPRLQTPALKTLETQFFSARPGSQSDTTGVELIEAVDRRAEVHAVARRIRQLLREGLRLRDIVVLTRDIDDYIDLIDASFREHDISFFVDRRRSAAHHPLLQMLRSTLQIALRNWPHDCVMSFIRCGLTGLTLAETDELENYALDHNIKNETWADPERWHYQRMIARGSEDEPASAEVVQLERIHALRMKFIARLGFTIARLRSTQPRTVREIVTDLFNLFEGFNVRGQLVAQMRKAVADNQLEARAETEQVWTELVELFSEMVDLLGDEPLPLETFIDILERGLEGFDLAITPQAVDELLVGDVDRTRTPEISTTFVLGLNEGVFPRAGREDSVFSDPERRLLERKIQLDADSRRQALNERFLGYLSITRSSKRLILSRSLSDNSGRPLNASPFWTRIRSILPEAPLAEYTHSSLSAPSCIGSAEQAIRRVLRWVREGADLSEPMLPDIYQWLTGRPELVAKTWPSLRYANEAKLSPETAQGLFPSPLAATAPQIESFAACPFQHFARYGLKLDARPELDVTGADLSRIYHRVLQHVVADVLARKIELTQLEPEQARLLIERHTQQVALSLRNEVMLGTARKRHLLDRIEHNLEQVMQTQTETSRHGEFQPRFTGVHFSSGGRISPLKLETPKGRVVQISGSIDRIDVSEKERAASVIDYKLSGAKLSWQEVYHGLSLQLLVYLLVLEANGKELAGQPLTPVAAFYAQLLRRLQMVDSPEDAPDPNDPLFHLDPKPRGVFDAAYLESLDRSMTTGASSVVSAYRRQDGGLGHRDRNDAADSAEFAALLQHVRETIQRLVDQLIDGDVSVTPYRLNNVSPCPTCPYRSVCRFDQNVNRYHFLNPVPRGEMFR